MPQTIHFEGLPGSGKSTAAKRLCELLRSTGIDAAWWLEESGDHPVLPKALRALWRESDYPRTCLLAWQEYFDSQHSGVDIFDGCALQSSVRFLYQNQRSQREIVEYFRQWQLLCPDTTLIYWLVDSPTEHFRQVFTERGAPWANKLFTWVAQTPVGLHRGWQGQRGFIEFWATYQDLCMALLEQATVPVEVAAARSWGDETLINLALEV